MVELLVISNSPRCNLGLFPSGVGSVWVCLDTGSPVGMDCKVGSEAADEEDSERQQRRIHEKICIGGESWQDQLLDKKGSRSGSSSAEDPGELLHQQTEGGSEHQQRRNQKKICIGRETRQDHLIDEKESRSESSSAGDPGELLHRQTEEGRSSTSSPMSTRNSRTVENRTNSKARIENGRKSDELKERSETE